MKTVMTFLISAALMTMPYGAYAQQEKTAPQIVGSQPSMGQSEQHPELRELWREHQKKINEMDARLDQKMAAMDVAKGEKKVDAIEAVIKEMVAQRKEMQEQMKEMRQKVAQVKKENAKKGENPAEKETGED